MKTQSKIFLSPMLNELEITSVKSLVDYTAYAQGTSAVVVNEVFMERFGIAEISELPSQSFNDAIRFLVDMKIDIVLN